jgi:hypothetical protein
VSQVGPAVVTGVCVLLVLRQILKLHRLNIAVDPVKTRKRDVLHKTLQPVLERSDRPSEQVMRFLDSLRAPFWAHSHPAIEEQCT